MLLIKMQLHKQYLIPLFVLYTYKRSDASCIFMGILLVEIFVKITIQKTVVCKMLRKLLKDDIYIWLKVSQGYQASGK